MAPATPCIASPLKFGTTLAAKSVIIASNLALVVALPAKVEAAVFERISFDVPLRSGFENPAEVPSEPANISIKEASSVSAFKAP